MGLIDQLKKNTVGALLGTIGICIGSLLVFAIIFFYIYLPNVIRAAGHTNRAQFVQMLFRFSQVVLDQISLADVYVRRLVAGREH